MNFVIFLLDIDEILLEFRDISQKNIPEHASKFGGTGGFPLRSKFAEIVPTLAHHLQKFRKYL